MVLTTLQVQWESRGPISVALGHGGDLPTHSHPSLFIHPSSTTVPVERPFLSFDFCHHPQPSRRRGVFTPDDPEVCTFRSTQDNVREWQGDTSQSGLGRNTSVGRRGSQLLLLLGSKILSSSLKDFLVFTLYLPFSKIVQAIPEKLDDRPQRFD